MRVLVIGSNGQLGCCLRDQLVDTNYEVIYTSRRQLDISDLNATRSKILRYAPDIVINASAYTNVDKAEEDRETADLINHIAVATIANVCFELDCWLIHVSTDYVFDGMANMPYCEDDQTNPKGVYGSTKLKGEIVIESSGCKYLIIRTAWLFSEYGNNFLKTMLRLGAKRDELSIVEDQTGCPTYGPDLAKGIVAILPRLRNNLSFSGLYHYSGNESCTWFDFATAIFDEAKLLGLEVPRVINPIMSCDFPAQAHRPLYSVLDSKRIHEAFGVASSQWRSSVPVVCELLKNFNDNER